jgi:threonine synthase
MSYVKHLVCVSCGKTYDAGEFRYLCPACNGFLDVEFDTSAIRANVRREDIDSRPLGVMQRWREFLPIEKTELIDRVTIGESVTPLVKSVRVAKRLGMKNLFFKNESAFPTGSLKDRSMPLVVLKALEFGFDTVSIVSSGNAAASLSAYAARAGLRAVVFVAGGRTARLAKCRSYGSTLVHVEAPYSQVEDLFMQARQAFGWYDCNGLVNPFRLEGKKTLAHEVCHQLGWTVPDVVILPTAFGNGLVSAWKGFAELEEMGWTKGRPAMWAAQPENCGPIARAYDSGASVVEPVQGKATVASSIAVGNPEIGGKRVLKVARESGGGVSAASEDLILEAQALLAREEGLFVEPSGASSLACLIKLLGEGRIAKDQVVVLSITGEGLNQPDALDAWAPEPFEVLPDLESLKRLMASISK